MAGTFVSTGAYTNLTRLELEQLRKADFFAGAKALTVGDSALPPEGVVGPGNINAEPYLTSQITPIEELLLTPVTQPGLVLFNQAFCGGQTASITVGTSGVVLSNLVPVVGPFVGAGPFGNYIQISGAANSANNGTFRLGAQLSSSSATFVNPNAVTDANNGSLKWQVVTDTNTWYGPSLITGSVSGKATGYASFTGVWQDGTTNFVTAGVQVGDLLLVKNTANAGVPGLNDYAVGNVEIAGTGGGGPTTLVIDTINNSYGSPGTPTQFTDWILINSIADAGVGLGHAILVSTSPTPHGYVTGQNIGISGVNNLSKVWEITVQSSTTFTLDNTIYGSDPTGPYTFSPGSATVANVYGYVVVRPSATQLFAVPGSGSTGNEQSFLAVVPGSTLHNNIAPTVDQINADRVTNLIPGQYGLNSTIDRADAVYAPPGPSNTLNLLGYRIILYPDNGSGTGPNMATPIATLNPVIDPSIPSTDQRFTVDYAAGVIRFSCEPQVGGVIKVAGGVNATTGRLNLYAVFWAINPSFAPGATPSLYSQNISTVYNLPLAPSKFYWNGNLGSWAFDTVSVATGSAFTTPLAGATMSGLGGFPLATGTNLVTIENLAGMYSGVVGANLTISNASIGVNNGTFPITAYTSSSTVSINNPGFGGATVTNIVNHGGAFQFVTALPTGLATGDTVYIVGVNGTGGFTTLSGFSYVITVQNSTHFTLNGTTFSGTYSSGGTIWDSNAEQDLITYAVAEPAVNITTLDKVDPSASIIKRLNAEFVITCGDGNLSFGDFNGTDAIDQAYAYWVSLSPQPLSCRIHAKRGSYNLNVAFDIGWNGSSSTAGYELIIEGDGRASTTLVINSNVGPPPHMAFVGAGSQFTLEDVFVDNNNSFGVNLGGSLRLRRVYWSGVAINVGVISDGLSPLTTTSETQAPPYLVICDDCVFFQAVWSFASTFSGSGLIWRNCSFSDFGICTFQFTAATTPNSWRHFIWEHCSFLVQGVSTTNSTTINGNGAFTAGIMGVQSSTDLTMTLDEFEFLDCHVSSTDTASESVILLHLFPLTYNATSTAHRVQIGSVTIRNGNWSIGSRGNDFVPFFLMCSNPVIENVKFSGGGLPFTGLSTAPGFRGNGSYTDAMRYALTGTNGYSGHASFLATIAASGQALFSTVAGTSGDMASITSGTVTFTDFVLSSLFVPGFQGLSITVSGASVAANNGTFPITGYSSGEVQYTNASATTGGETNNGSLTWSINASTESGMVVHNLEVNNVPVQSFSGDLCLVGPMLNGGPVDVNGVLVTNLAGEATTTNLPYARIYIRPGAQYTVGSNVATVTYPGAAAEGIIEGGFAGSSGAFRGISWVANTFAINAANESSGVYSIPFTNPTGTGSVSTGAICLGYTGDLQVDGLRVMAQLSFAPNATGGQQLDVVPMVAVTCTELWATFTPPTQRGHLRISNCYAQNLGTDSYSNALFSLSDFDTIDANSLEVYTNFNNLTRSSLSITGIQVYPQFTQRSSGGTAYPSTAGVAPIIQGPFTTSYASLAASSAGSMTVTGLLGMQLSDVGSYIYFSLASNSTNNGAFLITSVPSSTSVVVLQSNTHAADGNNGHILWGMINNLTTKWTLEKCRVEIDNIPIGLSGPTATPNVYGIQSYWTQGTAGGYFGPSTVITYGDCHGCHVNLNFTGTLATASAYGYNFVSLDQTGNGPYINCFSNTSQMFQPATGPILGFISCFYFVGSTITAISSGVQQYKGFVTSFAGGITNANPMVFNYANLVT